MKRISILTLFFISGGAFANELNGSGVLDTTITKFLTTAQTWLSVMQAEATWLFWTLSLISMAFTFGMMALKRAEIGEIFAELIRFIMFTGFFWWLLQNGPNFAMEILASLQKLAEHASGGGEVTPSGIVDIGLKIVTNAMDHFSAMNPVDSLFNGIISILILICLVVIATNLIVMYVSAYVLMYAGVIVLGFGGSRWTSDWAINYFRTIVNLAVQIMTMVLIVGIGGSLLKNFFSEMSSSGVNLNELGVMLVFVIVLLLISTKVPPMVGGLIIGGGCDGGMGAFTAGALMGGAMGASGVAGMAMNAVGSAVGGGAMGVAGGASSLKAAVNAARDYDAKHGINSSVMGTAMGAAGHLARGMGSMASESASKVASGFQKHLQETSAGKLADKIKSGATARGEPMTEGFRQHLMKTYSSEKATTGSMASNTNNKQQQTDAKSDQKQRTVANNEASVGGGMDKNNALPSGGENFSHQITKDSQESSSPTEFTAQTENKSDTSSAPNERFDYKPEFGGTDFKNEFSSEKEPPTPTEAFRGNAKKEEEMSYVDRIREQVRKEGLENDF